MEGYALDPNMLVNALTSKDNDAVGGNGLLWIFLLILFGGGGNGGGMTDGGCIGDITQITGWNAVQAEYEITEDALTVRSTGSYSMFYNNNIPTTGGSKFLIEGYITKGGTNTWISSYDLAYLRDNMIDDTHFSLELRANVANKAVSYLDGRGI